MAQKEGRVITWKTITITAIACALIAVGSIGGLGLIVYGNIGWGWAGIAMAVLNLAFLLWFCLWYMEGKGRIK